MAGLTYLEAIVVKRNIGIALFVLLVIATVVLVYFAVHSGGRYRPADSSPAPARAVPSSPTPSTSVDAPVLRLLVIGDSAAAGEGASVDTLGWVARVEASSGWDVTNSSVVGAGYVGRSATQGTCVRPSCPSLATILERSTSTSPDVVLVAAGREDDDTATNGQLSVATRSFFRTVRRAFPAATIVAVDPQYDASTTVSSPLDDGVRTAVRSVKGQYADVGQPLAGHAERVTQDGQEPNDSGHRALARAVLAQLRALDLG